MSRNPKIIAHRGYCEIYKDNSLKSYLKAIEAGADYIEVDIRQSADGELVCVHDPVVRLKRIDKTSAEKLSVMGILQLAEVLAALPDHAQILFDIKVKNDQAHQMLCDHVRQFKFENNCVFGVRSMGAAEFFLKHMPESRVLGFFKNYDDYDAFFKAGGDFARVWENDLSADIVAKIKKGDSTRKIWVTAYKSKWIKVGKISDQRLAKVLAHNIDGVILNDPKLMKSVLSKPLPAKAKRFKP